MKRAPKPLAPLGAARVIAASGDVVPGTVVQHPDGYYWVAADGRQQFGPFRSAAAARADRDRFDDGGPDAEESPHEAEAELGISDWLDPDTGDPGDGGFRPHLPED